MNSNQPIPPRNSKQFPLEIPLPYWYRPMTHQQDNGIELPPSPVKPTFEAVKAQLRNAVETYHEHPMFHGAVLSGVLLSSQYLAGGGTTPAELLQAAKEVGQDMGLLAVTANAKD